MGGVKNVITGKTDFNPRSREGSDEEWKNKFLEWQAFQSTLPRRERQAAGGQRPGKCNFNPRSREGSDNY